MKNLANGVGDLKKVMEGVKTRGIYGEVQLGAIIEDILTKNQYEENIATKKGNQRIFLLFVKSMFQHKKKNMFPYQK